MIGNVQTPDIRHAVASRDEMAKKSDLWRIGQTSYGIHISWQSLFLAVRESNWGQIKLNDRSNWGGLRRAKVVQHNRLKGDKEMVNIYEQGSNTISLSRHPQERRTTEKHDRQNDHGWPNMRREGRATREGRKRSKLEWNVGNIVVMNGWKHKEIQLTDSGI